MDTATIEPESFVPDDAPPTFEPESLPAKGVRLRAELETARAEGRSASRLLDPLLRIAAPSPEEAAAYASPMGYPLRPYRPTPALEPVREFVRGGTEQLAETTQAMTEPTNLPLLPLAAFAPARTAMGLYFGATAVGAGAGQLSAAQTPREAGAGLANVGLGSTLVKGGLAEPVLPRAQAALREVPDVGPVPVIDRAPVSAENAPAPETLLQEPSGMRLAPETAQPDPAGGIPANAEMLETLPKPTVEDLAINELTRAAGDEMK